MSHGRNIILLKTEASRCFRSNQSQLVVVVVAAAVVVVVVVMLRDKSAYSYSSQDGVIVILKAYGTYMVRVVRGVLEDKL